MSEETESQSDTSKTWKRIFSDPWIVWWLCIGHLYDHSQLVSSDLLKGIDMLCLIAVASSPWWLKNKP